MPDPAAVNLMFGRIAPRYDLANRVLSGGIDIHWRARLVLAVKGALPADVLDIATGSGDVALALSRALPAGTRITGMDFCAPMLALAESKRSGGRAGPAHLEFRLGDALNIPLADASLDAVTIAFGLRNMADRARCLSEIRRVLRPGGRLFVLEFSQPSRWVRPLYSFHLSRVVPRVAGILTGDRGAYEYLRDSIGAFPGRAALSAELVGSGFPEVSASAMTLGIVALHVARR